MDVSKHVMIFDPSKFTGQILIAGVGSIGSALALNLAKLGLGNRMSLMDPDTVEAHNISNQFIYSNNDIDKFKAFTAAHIIADLTNSNPDAYTQHLCHHNQVSNVTHLFVCVDSMAARTSIFNECVWMNPNLQYFADGRMSARLGMCYGFDPRDLPKAKEYRRRLYPDGDVPDEHIGGCSITPSIGATAMTVACQMTWQFINHFNGAMHTDLQADGKPGLGVKLPYEEIAFRVDNLEVHNKGWL